MGYLALLGISGVGTLSSGADVRDVLPPWSKARQPIGLIISNSYSLSLKRYV